MAQPPENLPPQLPPVIAPTTGSKETAEQSFLTAPQELDLSLRAWSARGGLVVAAILYGAGLYALCIFLGLWGFTAVAVEKWHIVVTTVVALFSVPTVILMTIIRSSSSAKTDPAADNLHALVGEKVVNLVEKVLEKVLSKGE